MSRKIAKSQLKKRLLVIGFSFRLSPDQKLPHLTKWGNWGKLNRRCLGYVPFE